MKASTALDLRQAARGLPPRSPAAAAPALHPSVADRHVLDHAAAKRAHLSHREISCLKDWALNPRSSQTGGDLRDRASTAAASGFVQSRGHDLAQVNVNSTSRRYVSPVPRNLTSPPRWPYFTVAATDRRVSNGRGNRKCRDRLDPRHQTLIIRKVAAKLVRCLEGQQVGRQWQGQGRQGEEGQGTRRRRQRPISDHSRNGDRDAIHEAAHPCIARALGYAVVTLSLTSASGSPRDGWMKLLKARASHCSPCTAWVSAVSHKCIVANTNPPSSKATAVGMHVSKGGLTGWRSIGTSVTLKKMLPAESTISCQRSGPISESNSPTRIFAIPPARDSPCLKGRPKTG